MILTRRKLVAMAGLATFAPSLVAAKSDPTSREMVLNDPDAPVLGNPKGDVTVVEYFDYQCPYCKTSYEMVRDVVEQDGKVRLVLKDWPVFGGASVMAAQAVLASAKLGKYDKALDAMFHTPNKLQQDDVEKALAKAGLTFEGVARPLFSIRRGFPACWTGTGCRPPPSNLSAHPHLSSGRQALPASSTARV